MPTKHLPFLLYPLSIKDKFFQDSEYIYNVYIDNIASEIHYLLMLSQRTHFILEWMWFYNDKSKP